MKRQVLDVFIPGDHPHMQQESVSRYAVAYQTPVGTFDDPATAALACVHNDFDPEECVELVLVAYTAHLRNGRVLGRMPAECFAEA